MHTHLHAPLQYTDDRDQRTRQIQQAASYGADTIGWTEVQRPDQVSRIRLLPGYETWWPSGRPEVRPLNFAPISWRTDRFRLRGHERRKASDGLAGEFPDKHFTAVILEDLRTGEVVRRVQAHMVPGIQSLRDEPPAARAATIRAHANNVRVFRSLCLAGDRPVIGTTDANTTDLPDLLRSSGLLMTGVGPTHGNRAIDWAVSLGYRIAAKRAVRIGSSDHRGILLTAETVAPREEPDVDHFIPYSDWSRRPRGATRSSHPIGATDGITAHWEGPGMGDFPHADCAGKVRGIQAFHRDTRRWADIAYNAIVCPHGYVFEGRGAAVKSAANGSSGANDTHYAVCYLGGVGDGFTDEGKAGFLAAFDWLAREGGAGPERNGHKDHKATQCPGPDIYRWVSNLPPGASARPVTDEEFDMAGITEERFVELVAKGVREALSREQTNDKSVAGNIRDGAFLSAKELDIIATSVAAKIKES